VDSLGQVEEIFGDYLENRHRYMEAVPSPADERDGALQELRGEG
jgi:hypothetical protein